MFSNKRIVIAGGTGFVGQGMTECWAGGNDITILTLIRKDLTIAMAGRRLTIA
jgi:NAD dependent epimerase/dehydratase family enzyme